MTSEQIAGLARHVLTTLGGFAVAKGWLDGATVITLVGAVSALVGVAWSLLAKKPVLA